MNRQVILISRRIWSVATSKSISRMQYPNRSRQAEVKKCLKHSGPIHSFHFLFHEPPNPTYCFFFLTKHIYANSISAQSIIMNTLTMEDITMEEKIMDKTLSIIFLFHRLFFLTNVLIICTILGTFLSYSLETVFDIEISILYLFGICLILHTVILLPIYSIRGLAATSLHYPHLIQSLYAGRSDANMTLNLLRESMKTIPFQRQYSTETRFSPHFAIYHAAILWFGPNVDDANIAVAEAWIEMLAESITQSDFIGTARLLKKSNGIDIYAFVYCRNSWGGLARRIAKRQLGNSTLDVLSPSERTPLLP